MFSCRAHRIKMFFTQKCQHCLNCNFKISQLHRTVSDCTRLVFHTYMNQVLSSRVLEHFTLWYFKIAVRFEIICHVLLPISICCHLYSTLQYLWMNCNLYLENNAIYFMWITEMICFISGENVSYYIHSSVKLVLV